MSAARALWLRDRAALCRETADDLILAARRYEAEMDEILRQEDERRLARADKREAQTWLGKQVRERKEEAA